MAAWPHGRKFCSSVNNPALFRNNPGWRILHLLMINLKIECVTQKGRFFLCSDFAAMRRCGDAAFGFIDLLKNEYLTKNDIFLFFIYLYETERRIAASPQIWFLCQ